MDLIGVGLKAIEASISTEKSLKVPRSSTFKLFSVYHVSAKLCKSEIGIDVGLFRQRILRTIL